MTAAMPTGMLMKKIHRQPMLVTMYPPRVGPIVRPAMTTASKKAWAMACSDFGKVSKRNDCALASRPPPPSPWRTRAMTSVTRLVETPQRIDARVKAMSEKME